MGHICSNRCPFSSPSSSRDTSLHWRESKCALGTSPNGGSFEPFRLVHSSLPNTFYFIHSTGMLRTNICIILCSPLSIVCTSEKPMSHLYLHCHTANLSTKKETVVRVENTLMVCIHFYLTTLRAAAITALHSCPCFKSKVQCRYSVTSPLQLMTGSTYWSAKMKNSL